MRILVVLRNRKTEGISLIGAIPKRFHKNTQSKVGQKHDFIFKYVDKVTSSDLQSHHQAILNHINIGILSGNAHIWDPQMLNILGSQRCALSLNIPTLVWFKMA